MVFDSSKGREERAGSLQELLVEQEDIRGSVYRKSFHTSATATVVVIDVSAERDSYGQVTKGLQWMPRSHLAKKAVVSCEKRRGRANIL